MISKKLPNERPGTSRPGVSGVRTADRWEEGAPASETPASLRKSQSTPSIPRGEPSELHEVWWSDQGNLALRARFRLLPDALRFIWGNHRQEAAWVKLKDGRWVHAQSFDEEQHGPVSGRARGSRRARSSQPGRSSRPGESARPPHSMAPHSQAPHSQAPHSAGRSPRSSRPGKPVPALRRRMRSSTGLSGDDER